LVHCRRPSAKIHPTVWIRTLKKKDEKEEMKYEIKEKYKVTGKGRQGENK
jgi:hypothetical protein